MSLRVMDGLVAWRRSLAAPGGPAAGISFAHYLQADTANAPKPACLIVDIKPESDTDVPVCVRFLVTETLTCEGLSASSNDSVQSAVEKIRLVLSGANLDGLAKTNGFVLHTHVLRPGPLKRSRGGTQVTLRWTVIASWRP